MKSTVEDRDPKPCNDLPRLMREINFPDVVVLLYYKNGDGSFEGVVVAGDSRPIGYTYSRWEPFTLEPFHGTVTLEQD